MEVVKYTDEWFLNLYLKYGSVEEAMNSYPEPLPISAANFHRLVIKYGLIGSAGRHVSLPETLHFFREKAFAPGTPLEKLYKSMPLDFKTSMSTLHRIYQLVEKSTVRRSGTALIIKPESNPGLVLVGQEVSENTRYGKKSGDISIPMGFSKRDESARESVLRILQQEVFSGLASRGLLKTGAKSTRKILPNNIEPFAYFDIVDVRVKLFSITLPVESNADFESHRLRGLRFVKMGSFKKLKTRVGVSEILEVYGKYTYKTYEEPFPAHYISSLNLSLALVPQL